MKATLVQSTRDAGHYRLGQYFSREGVVLAVDDYTPAEWAILEADGYLKLTPENEVDELIETEQTRTDVDELIEAEQMQVDVNEPAAPVVVKPEVAKK